MYKNLLRPLLFKIDPEKAHHIAMKAGQFAYKSGLLPFVKALYYFEDKSLEQELFGLKFKNPVGLAAGSDKNCEAQELLSAFGFGFLESVSFAYEEQPGNPKPRIFRYPVDEALINRMGFPSLGAEKLAGRIEKSARIINSDGVVFAVNFAKSKNVPLENAAEDYLKSFRLMRRLVNYIVINVSSPNTPGLRTLQEKTRLDEILKALQAENTDKIPLLVKLAPDLSFDEVDDVLECAAQNNLQGIVATNTTKSRDGLNTSTAEEGGMSGKPLFPISLRYVSHIRKQLNGKLKIIGVGGISSAEQAIQMISAGADLIEIYTGLIYQGPAVVYKIKKGLVTYMKNNGIKNITELTGCNNK